jgi:hypothetical protein
MSTTHVALQMSPEQIIWSSHEFILASLPIIQAFTTHMASMYLKVDMNNKAELKTNTSSSTGSADILNKQII